MKKIVKKHLTSDVPQPYIVTMAVYLLDGARKPADIEDVAMKCHELAPGRFSWRKYPDQINLDYVRRELSRAKTEEFNALIKGSMTDGWTLTPTGLEWASRNADSVARIDLGKEHTAARTTSSDDARKERELTRIRTTKAWHRWESGDSDFSLQEAREVFRIDSYATGRMRDLKINRLEILFEDSVEVMKFLDEVRAAVESEGDIK
jgi:hypothetical protein